MTTGLACPICKEKRLIPYDECDYNTGRIYMVLLPEPMYQYSYPGQKLYITPRCDDCMQRALKKREEKQS